MPCVACLSFHLMIDLLLIDENPLLLFLLRMDNIELHSQFSWSSNTQYKVELKWFFKLMKAFMLSVIGFVCMFIYVHIPLI